MHPVALTGTFLMAAGLAAPPPLAVPLKKIAVKAARASAFELNRAKGSTGWGSGAASSLRGVPPLLGRSAWLAAASASSVTSRGAKPRMVHLHCTSRRRRWSIQVSMNGRQEAWLLLPPITALCHGRPPPAPSIPCLEGGTARPTRQLGGTHLRRAAPNPPPVSATPSLTYTRLPTRPPPHPAALPSCPCPQVPPAPAPP